MAKQIEDFFEKESTDHCGLSYAIIHKQELTDLLSYLIERNASFKVTFKENEQQA